MHCVTCPVLKFETRGENDTFKYSKYSCTLYTVCCMWWEMVKDVAGNRGQIFPRRKEHIL